MLFLIVLKRPNVSIRYISFELLSEVLSNGVNSIKIASILAEIQDDNVWDESKIHKIDVLPPVAA